MPWPSGVSLGKRKVKRLLWRELSKVLSVPGSERSAWEGGLERVMTNELTRMDVISHFNVVADLIRSRHVRARANAG